MRKLCLALGWMVICSPAFAAEVPSFPTTPPTDPKDAAKTFQVLDGFTMQLIAAEPLVTDPVAITYDEDGRAFVCEMNDYPYTDKSTHKPSQENPTDLPLGKVRLLTDTDGDGVFDKATVFAEGLSWPTGAACWKGGIFVTATPDVWYLKDTNGDGVADVRQKIFTGFKKLNVQAVMNNPIWGLDHRIYVAGGSNGGEIQRAPGSESVMPLPKDLKPLAMKRHDFSFDPSTGDVRLESGGARFGNTFDDWGNRFLCNIRNPCQHVVLPYRYLERNPYLVIPSALNDCAEAGDQLPVYRTSPPEPWREFRAKRWVQEGSHLPKSELVGAGVVTSSAGITVYRGDAYPPEYRNFAFVADVAGNLFYRMKLVPAGVTFKAIQVDGTKNFCTSDDLWHRPVNFVNAPDGCLHVCDMYREVIEHPWSIPDDIHAVVDLLRGRDKGRLYRLAPANFKPRATPKLSTESTAELVALLDHPNAWHRETAQRLLFERQDEATAGPLRALLTTAKTPQGKIHGLWSLRHLRPGLQELKAAFEGLLQKQDEIPPEVQERSVVALQLEDIATLISSSNSHVLQHCFQVAEDMVSPVEMIELPVPMPQTETDQMAVNVVFQFALSEGRLPVNSWTGLGLEIAYYEDHLNDPWVRAAILMQGGSAAWASRMIRGGCPDSEFLADFGQRSFELAALGDSPTEWSSPEKLIADLASAEAAKSPQASKAALLGLLRGIEKRGFGLETLKPTPETERWLEERFASAVLEIESGTSSTDDRINAVYLLGASGTLLGQHQATLQTLLLPHQPAELQTASLDALSYSHDPAVAELLIQSWSKFTPALREKATTLLLSRTDRIAKLLDAIEAKKITPAQLSAAAKATLGRQKNPVLAERVAKLIGDGGSSNRKEVIAKYASVLTMAGDAANGAKIYEAACMVCHRHKDHGNDVGPNLGTIQGWTAEQIVTNVLDPNREVSPNFALYIVDTHDGRTLSGLITSETGGNLTLKRADGGTDTVLRSEIKSLTSPGISLMPEGLEAAITPQQMADLIAYLKGG